MTVSFPFHLAFPVDDLAKTRAFYCDVLGCRVGRSAERWVDFDFFGHQLSAHLRQLPDEQNLACNAVDGDAVPTRHFGVIVDWDSFAALRQKLEANNTVFRIAPRIRFAGEVGEQATMFFDDPSGNAIEIKSFRDPSRIFLAEETSSGSQLH